MNAMPHIGVVGRSIGGLTAALVLRDLGCEVDVFERSGTALEARGAGIGLHPMTTRAPRHAAVATAVRERGAGYEATFAWRATARPEAELAPAMLRGAAQARYAGYVAWRATVPESELAPASFEALRNSIGLLPSGHVLVYPIPSLDGDLEPGRRLANLVWYHNYEAGAGSPATRRSASACTGRDGNRADAGLHPPYGFPNVAIRSIRHSNSTRFSSIAGSRNP